VRDGQSLELPVTLQERPENIQEFITP
jgi:hypothetical protein